MTDVTVGAGGPGPPTTPFYHFHRLKVGTMVGTDSFLLLDNISYLPLYLCSVIYREGVYQHENDKYFLGFHVLYGYATALAPLLNKYPSVKLLWSLYKVTYA